MSDLTILHTIGTVGICGVGLLCCLIALGNGTETRRYAGEALFVVGAWQMTFVVTRTLVQVGAMERGFAMLVGGLGAWACLMILAQIAVVLAAHEREKGRAT